MPFSSKKSECRPPATTPTIPEPGPEPKTPWEIFSSTHVFLVGLDNSSRILGPMPN